MFVKAICPACGCEIYHDITIHTLEYKRFEGENQAYRYVMDEVEMVDTLKEDDLIRDVLKGLHKIVHDGIEINVLAGILKENYGVTGACCRDLIERIQLDLDMYCPDTKRLYFVSPENY